MPDETIQVVYKPVASVGNVTGYHETLVYTGRNGKQEFASAYASNTSPDGNPASDLVRASSAVHGKAGSPYGVLKTETGDAAGANIFGPPSHPMQTETVAHGPSLASQWARVKEAYAEVGAGNIAYSPLTQNSNSTASTAMIAAGIRPPTDNGMMGHHWTPAADNILPIPALSHTATTGVSSQAVPQAARQVDTPAPDPWKATAARAPGPDSPGSGERRSVGMRP